jgi:hypothetical protein
VRLKINVTGDFVLRLTVDEIMALEALVSYGDDAFIKGCYKCLGVSYIQPYESGIRSLLKTIKEQCAGPAREIHEFQRKISMGLRAVNVEEPK